MQSFDKTFDFPYLEFMQIVCSDKNYAVGSLVIKTFNCGSGFPRRGRQLSRGCSNLLFCKLFAENFMKMTEFGKQGGVSLAPLGSATGFK